MSLKNILRRACAAGLALSLLVLPACGDARKSSKAERQTVLTIDGFEVPYEQFRYLVCNYMDTYAEGKTDYWNEETAALAQDEIFEECFDTLCSQYAALSLCREYGVDTSGGAIDELVETLMADYIAQYESEDAYAAALREGYLNDSVYRFFTTVSVSMPRLAKCSVTEQIFLISPSLSGKMLVFIFCKMYRFSVVVTNIVTLICPSPYGSIESTSPTI